MADVLNIGIVGTAFMGRAHSNAFLDVPHYFELAKPVVMRAACSVDAQELDGLVKKYGWLSKESSYEKLVKRDDIDVVDICTPNNSHMPIAVAAAKAGKHVICEKPLCMNAKEAAKMLEAVEKAGVRHMTAFNYRRVPAIMLAKKLIEEGKLGTIHHFNAVYYQDWLVDPKFPMVWRHNASVAGSGAHGDLNAHTVDLARYLVGEFEAVCSEKKTFIKERVYADGKGKGKVTVDDALTMLARFRNGALGNFTATRFATGRKNYLRLEIFGSEGGLIFNLERLNELEFYDRKDDPKAQGFRNIMVTDSIHPFMHKWWPPGHVIGWEHTFIHEVGDFLTAVLEKKHVRPDFYDGLRCQQVLDAAWISAAKQKWVKIPEK
jgi:predicted dehydrogenase